MKDAVKMGKKLVAIENEVEFESLDRFERLFHQSLSSPFSAVFVRTGTRSTRTAAKTLEERDRTWQRSVPCLLNILDRSIKGHIWG